MTKATCAMFLTLAVTGAAGSARASDAPAAPTFAKDVAPILYNNCVVCHRPGEVAPMSLITYQNVRPWARCSTVGRSPAALLMADF